MFRGLSSLAPGRDGDRSGFGTRVTATWRSQLEKTTKTVDRETQYVQYVH